MSPQNSNRSKDALANCLMPEQCVWGLAESGTESFPLFIRYNESAHDCIGHKDLPIKLGFAIPLNSANEGGLPSSVELTQLDAIEDTIVREVGLKTRGMYVLTLTTGSMREHVFYVLEGTDIMSIHESVKALVDTHEVQCMAVREPDWRSYLDFTP
jgi:hypothetical protein